MTDSLRVTIAIPTLNRAEYLRMALASALSQSYANLEVIVSDNASTDHTARFLDSIADPRVRLLRKESTVGMMENWNSCLDAATGEYFLLLSDDDLLEPGAISEMVRLFEGAQLSGAPVGFVYCGSTVIDERGEILSLGCRAPVNEAAPELIIRFFEGRRTLYPCAILFRTSDLASGYDVRFPLAADAAQWIRIAAAYGTAGFVDQRLARYRMHQNTTVRTPAAVYRKENEALGDYAITELRKSGAELAEEVRRAVSGLNARITSEIINFNLRPSKPRAISQYWSNREAFRGPYGVLIVIKGLILLILPDFLRRNVRRMLFG